MATASTNISSIKAFAQSNGASPIPSNYHSFTDIDEVADELGASIPVIDFCLLTSDDPQIHTKAVDELAKACAEWGFFMLINHGISESLMEELMKKSREFHDLPMEEKKEFCDKGEPFSPIRHGTSFRPPVENVHYWRDFLKVLITSSQFKFPHKPPGFREVGFEYTKKIAGIARKLIQGISESLRLESNSIIDFSGFDFGSQIFGVNLYPPCPQPHLALGLPSHSDVGFLTFLIQNGIGGLQVKHEGKWVNVNPISNSLVVNIGDQLEVVSNGKYSSVLHRAILNNKETRVSVVVDNGPALLDNKIGPIPKLLEKEKPLFKSIKYRDYFVVQQKSRLSDGKVLDQIRYSA